MEKAKNRNKHPHDHQICLPSKGTITIYWCSSFEPKQTPVLWALTTSTYQFIQFINLTCNKVIIVKSTVSGFSMFFIHVSDPQKQHTRRLCRCSLTRNHIACLRVKIWELNLRETWHICVPDSMLFHDGSWWWFQKQQQNTTFNWLSVINHSVKFSS